MKPLTWITEKSLHSCINGQRRTKISDINAFVDQAQQLQSKSLRIWHITMQTQHLQFPVYVNAVCYIAQAHRFASIGFKATLVLIEPTKLVVADVSEGQCQCCVLQNTRSEHNQQPTLVTPMHAWLRKQGSLKLSTVWVVDTLNHFKTMYTIT